MWREDIRSGQVSHKPGSVCKPFPWNALVQLLSHSCVMITKVHLPPFVLLTKQHTPVPHTLTNTLAECSHYTGLDRLVYAKSVTTTLNKTRPDDLPFCPNYIALCMWHLALINTMDAFFKAVGMILLVLMHYLIQENHSFEKWFQLFYWLSSE